MSNLRINTSKTKIILSGGLPSLEFLSKAEELGFELNENFEVLGFLLNRDMSNLDENWNKILVKIHKIRNFWNLLHLSAK